MTQITVFYSEDRNTSIFTTFHSEIYKEQDL